MNYRKKPTIIINGCEHSAFKLLMRAKKALARAGADSNELHLFAVECGVDDIMRQATWETPKRVYRRVLQVVSEKCKIRAIQ